VTHPYLEHLQRLPKGPRFYVCLPVVMDPTPQPGIQQSKCEECGRPVWIDRRAYDAANRGAAHRLREICFFCAKREELMLFGRGVQVTQ